MTLLCTECKNTRASFGLLDDKKATYCGSCKKEGMVDLRHPKCIECKIKHSSFGLPDDKKQPIVDLARKKE
jgi:hypothetical protein